MSTNQKSSYTNVIGATAPPRSKAMSSSSHEEAQGAPEAERRQRQPPRTTTQGDRTEPRRSPGAPHARACGIRSDEATKWIQNQLYAPDVVLSQGSPNEVHDLQINDAFDMRRSSQQLDKNEVAAAATGDVSSDWSRSPAAAKKIVTNKVDEQLRWQRRQTFHTLPAEQPKGSSKIRSSPPHRVSSGITAAPRPTGNPPRSPPKVARSLVSSPLPRRVICSSSVTSSAPGSCSTSPSCVRGPPKPQARSLGDGGSLGGSPSGSPSG